MIAFGRTCAAIGATASTLQKVDLLAGYLRDLAEPDLGPATRYFTGNPFPQAETRSLSVGGRTLVEAAAATWGVDDRALAAAYRSTGDLGAALGPFVRAPVTLALFREALTPAGLYALLLEIAGAHGKLAQKRRRVLCERVLSACVDPIEATYVLKIMAGELRIGLRAGLVIDAIAKAYGRDQRGVRRAAAAAGDLGAVALAAKADALEGLTVVYHAPLAFMLASPLAYGTTYAELTDAVWVIDDKYDGVRVQAHVTPGRISLFSRTLNDVAGAFPEIVAALRRLKGSFALDGELVAMQRDRVLPFRFLQSRLQRKTVTDALQREVPVQYVAFDALAQGDEILLDLPLLERRKRLAAILAGAAEPLVLAPWTVLERGAPSEEVRLRFERARAQGHEGLVLKRADSAYAPGRRGKSWLKLKRELATLDCVVVAVERGHGRRIDVLSDYTFAVADGERLAVIGKAFNGLTDAEIALMTTWFEAHRLPPLEAKAAYERLDLKRGEIVVEAQVVIEVAFDIVQPSRLHAGGFSLRFPRIVRLRPDKPVREISTLQDVKAVYADMLAREGIER